jgi:hypothetical protein
MDVSDASYYIHTVKITKIKVAKWGTPKKREREKKKKNTLQSQYLEIHFSSFN